jgi:hypothetical protein
MKFKLATAFLAAAFLTACGGGGNDSLTANTPPPSSPPPPPSAPIASGPTYEAVDYVVSRAALTAQANAQGARGFAYYSGLVLDETPLTSGDQIFTNLYVKEANTTFTYEALDLPTTRQALLTQLNAQGSRGFAWYSGISGSNDSYSFFVKEGNVNSITYEFLDETTTATGFLNQANAQGARGFIYSGGYTTGGSSFNIYGKLNGSNARYNYRLDNVPTTQSDLLTQVNRQGQEGYVFVGGQVFVGEPINAQRIFQLFVKDTAQNATFEWRGLPVINTPAGLVTQANNQGLERYRLFGYYATTQGSVTSIATLYARSNNCTGILCSVNSPF